MRPLAVLRSWSPAILCCSLLGPGAPAVAAGGPAAPFELRGMTYVGSEGGHNEVVIDARRAQIYPDRDVAELEQVHLAVAAGPQGGGSLDLRCQRGRFGLETGDFEAIGDVRGTTADGRVFHTRRLEYRHADGVVRGNDPVVIQGAAGTLRGGGFEYRVRDDRFRLIGGAEVVHE